MSALDNVIIQSMLPADRSMSIKAAAREELRELRVTVAALTAERDAAYRRGWDDSNQASIDAVDNLKIDIDELFDTKLNRDIEIIRVLESLQPPTAPTEHHAETLEALHERL